MKEKINLANVITGSRIIFAISILFTPVFSKVFYICYLLGAFSDMIDGTIARKLNINSTFGAKLDSVADFTFVTAVLFTVLSSVSVPGYIWIWIIIIAVIKIFTLCYSFIVFHRIAAMHTIMNKVTGFLLFLLPLNAGISKWDGLLLVICLVATFAAIQECVYVLNGKEIE